MHWNGFESEKSCSQSAIRKGLGLLVPPPPASCFCVSVYQLPGKRQTLKDPERCIHQRRGWAPHLGYRIGAQLICQGAAQRSCACRGNGRFLCINHRQPGSQPSLLPQPQQGLPPNGLPFWIMPLQDQLQAVHQLHCPGCSRCCRHQPFGVFV